MNQDSARAAPIPATDDTAVRDGLDGAPTSAPWSDLFALTVEFDVAEGDFERFLALLRDNAARSVQAEPGCLRFDILVPENARASRTVLLYEIYTDRAAFDDHLSSEHYRNFDSETRSMVSRKLAVSFRLCEHTKGPNRSDPDQRRSNAA